jgi:hypothetical protein
MSSPGVMAVVAFSSPTSVGTPNSRATDAICPVTLPTSVMMARMRSMTGT